MFTGAGRDFCAGGDVKAMGAAGPPTPERRHAAMTRYRELTLALTGFDGPLVSAPDGVDYGVGVSIALIADLVPISTRVRCAASPPANRRASAGLPSPLHFNRRPMIDYDKTKAWRSGDIRHAYTTRDTILYALGLGAGQDPLDAAELRLTYEENLLALPTMAAVLASPGFWMRERKELGIDFVKLLHGEQRVTILEPLPVAGTLVGASRVTRIVDKGEGKGAVMTVEKQLRDEASGELIAVAEQTLFLRGDGGFSKNGGGDEAGPAPASVPKTAPEFTIDLPTRPEAALIYRLSGDINPLHVDPEVAAKAGFPKPILHGLATYGAACRGIVKAFCGGDPRQLKSFGARLTSPVFPGETLRLEAWRVSPSAAAFRCRVVERDVVVLANGSAAL